MSNARFKPAPTRASCVVNRSRRGNVSFSAAFFAASIAWPQYADIHLRLERTGELVEQRAAVGQFALVQLVLGLDVGDREVVLVGLPGELVVLAAQFREPVLEPRQFLGQRDLLALDLRPELGEFGHALLQLFGGGLGQAAGDLGARLLAGAADGEAEGRDGGEEEVHCSTTGRGR
jgi:hypothetical protein